MNSEIFKSNSLNRGDNSSILRLSHTVTAETAGRTVEQVLHRELSFPDGLIAHLKYVPDGITVNGVAARVTVRVREGDTVAARIDDAGEENPAKAVDCGVKVVWEDDFLAVLDKPAGVCVHGTPDGTPTVANAAAYLWGNAQPFHPVNRLDRGTSGLLVAAKCRFIHGKLQNQLHSDDFRRVYLAIAEGKLPPAGRIETPVDGRYACTDFESLAYGNIPLFGSVLSADSGLDSAEKPLTFVRLTLHTGRTHQIREHLAGLGCPLTGDTLYGGSVFGSSPSPAFSRPALHSAQVSLLHPVTGERIEVFAPLPSDMEALAIHAGITPASFSHFSHFSHFSL